MSVICQDIDQVNFHQYNVMYFIRTCIRSISGYISGQSEFLRTGQDIGYVSGQDEFEKGMYQVKVSLIRTCIRSR